MELTGLTPFVAYLLSAENIPEIKRYKKKMANRGHNKIIRTLCFNTNTSFSSIQTKNLSVKKAIADPHNM